MEDITKVNQIEISKQRLTNQLWEMETDGILERIIFAEMPPRVEYKITPHGETLLPIIDAMQAWGRKQMDSSL